MRLLVAAALGVFFVAPALAADNSALVAAGRYQAVLGDCVGCHTAPSGKTFAGGLALATPFGKLVTPNITSDRDTGIGNWSEADFRAAVKQGIAPGGKRLYPAMPYPAYAKMSDGDVSALWAYMKSIAPVRNAVEVNQLRFPYNIRLTMAGWNFLNFRPAPFSPDSAKSAPWNRGAYLVNGPAHCGACHTPKSLFGADKSEQTLAGASLQDWFAPDITSHRMLGIGDWSQADLVSYLKTGWNAHAAATGPMAEAVENSTSHMTDADLNAIAAYLKDGPASSRPAPQMAVADDPHRKAGEAIYEDNCAACHGRDGKGESRLFPPLAHNAIVQQDSIETLARVVLAGARAAQTRDTPTAPAMPSFAWRLNDQQIADVLTYIRSNWGNQAAPVATDRVTAIRARLRSGS